MAQANIWPSQTFEALIGAIGKPSLGDVILGIAEGLAGVDEVFGFWMDREGAPVQLASSGHQGSAKKRASLYASDFHAHDPLLPAIRAVDEREQVVVTSLRAADIPDPIYRRECFDRPGLAEKISFVRSVGRRRYVLSFYRSGHHRPLRSERLRPLAELTLPILRRHGEILGDEVNLTSLQRVEHRLARAYPELTGREWQVCARTLMGMTAEATALNLGVSEATVHTYRRRAYGRYGVSSAGQFLENLLK